MIYQARNSACYSTVCVDALKQGIMMIHARPLWQSVLQGWTRLQVWTRK